MFRTKPDGDRVFGGVCGGLAKATGVPSFWFRVMFLLPFFFLIWPPAFIYLTLWLCLPEEP